MSFQNKHNEARTGRGGFCRQLLATLLASRGMSCLSNSMSWNIAGNPQLENDVGGLGLTAEQKAWVVSTVFIGAGLGCLLGAWLNDRFGPRNILGISLVLSALGNISAVFAYNFATLLAGRLLTSVVSGLPLATCMMYVSGTCSPRYRGAFSLLVDVIVMSETIAIIFLSDYISWWWISVFIGGVAALPGVVLFALLPSDPVWLFHKGRHDEARRSSTFFGLDIHEDLSSCVENQDRSLVSLKMFTSGENVKPLVIVLVNFLFSAFCGNVTISNYSLVFFRKAGITMDATLCSALFTTCRVLATALSAFLVDRFGRRVLVLASSGGMSVCYIMLVVYYRVPFLQTFSVLPTVLILATACIYAVGIGCVPWCLQGEIFPLEMRQLGGCLPPAFYCFFLYASIYTFPLILDATGESGLFIFYACTMAAFFIFELIFLPETKGLTLAQIEVLFVKKNSCDLPEESEQAVVSVQGSQSKKIGEGDTDA